MRSGFIEKLFQSINESPKLEFYSTVKKHFKLEEYLNCPIFKYRAALTRLRISAHNLEIERGRYGNAPISRDKRFCRYCQEVLQIQVVESEKHVLNDCLLYIKHRTEFINNVRFNENLSQTVSPRSNTSSQNETSTHASDFATTSFHISKFCYKIFDHRNAFYNFLDDYTD